jgi:beta-glucuronidase
MEAVRGLAARGLKNDVRVTFDEGTYELSAPLIFTAADSGTPQYSVTYAAAPGKRVVISGGRAMKGWKQEGRKWTAELPSVKIGCPVEDIGGNGLVVG